jgi:membrane protease subunit HflK
MDLRIKAALISILVNVGLVIFKFFLGRVSGSASLHADAWHSISDLTVSLFVLGGLKITTTSERRGLVNWRGLEHVIALIVGVFIGYTGWRIFADALRQPSQELRNLGWVIVGALCCVLASFVIASMKIRVGRLRNSPSLVADGYHSKMDMYSTLAVVIGLFGVMIGINLDRVAAGLVSIFILVTGLEIMVGSIKAIVAGTPITNYFLSFFFELAGGRQRRGGRLADSVAQGFRWLGSGRRYAYLIGGVLAATWLLSSFYVLRQGEEGIVYRFGRLTKSGIPPGLHYHAPVPIEKVERIAVGTVQRVELGFRTIGRGGGGARAYQWESRHQTGSYEKRLDESLIFTGDENIIDINTVIQFKVKHPVSYALNIESPGEIVRSYGQATLRRIASSIEIERLLTSNRTMIEEMVGVSLQALLDVSASGIEVITVKLQDVHPPMEVVSAFRDVASAREDRSRLVNQASAYRDSLIPEVRGLGAQMLADARAESTEAIERAHGEARRFLEVVKQYEKSREVTGLRMYLETMEKVLPGLDKFIVEPDAGGEPIDLRFFDENITGTRGGW